jgi:hypothetical protein
MGTSLAAPQNVIQNTTSIRSYNPASGYTLKRTESGFLKRYLYTLFTAYLFTITQIRKQSHHPSTGERVSKIQHIHKKEHSKSSKGGSDTCQCVDECWDAMLSEIH